MKTGHEIVWSLKGQTPDRLPMSRLADYMQQLALLLGQQADVRFVRVEKGSVKLHVKAVQGGTAGRIAARVDAVRRRKAPADAMRAYDRINRMVYEDGGPARLSGPAALLHFPGAKPEDNTALKISDYSDIVGKLYLLAEAKDGSVSARIRPLDGDAYIQCSATPVVGKSLRQHLFEPVRVTGYGTWIARGEAWVCQGLEIDEVWPVKPGTLRDAIDAIRELDVDWPEDPIADMDKLNEIGGVA